MQQSRAEITEKIRENFYGTVDLVAREISADNLKATFYFIDGMCNTVQLETSIIGHLLRTLAEGRLEISPEGIKSAVQFSGNIKDIGDLDEAISIIASGDAIAKFDGIESLMSFAVKKSNTRAVTEPPTNTVLKGPREGFVEDLKTNMVLLRRRIRSSKLVFLNLTVGRFSETVVSVAFLKGVAKQEIIDKITERLKSLDVDGILDSSSLTKLLEARPYSIFKQVGTCEKPDILAAKLLDGRVAVMVDGSPIALTLPFMLVEDFHDATDGHKRPTRVSFLQLVRLLAIALAVLLPALYVSVQVHNFQLLPQPLLLTVLNSTSGLPFSPPLEMLLAVLIFEILSEASLRMPRHIGMAVSVVGAVVLGDTAVKAGVLCSLTVLCVALSSISIYAVPDDVGEFSIMRILFVLVSGLFGLYGLILVFIVFAVYLCAVDSFNTPYFAPFAPLNSDMVGIVFKKTIQDDKHRTKALELENRTKVGKEAE